jgi:hypothetical protein
MGAEPNDGPPEGPPKDKRPDDDRRYLMLSLALAAIWLASWGIIGVNCSGL